MQNTLCCAEEEALWINNSHSIHKLSTGNAHALYLYAYKINAADREIAAITCYPIVNCNN